MTTGITGHPLQAAQAVVNNDGTMSYHFRDWTFRVNQAVGDASLVSVWGFISGTMADQTDLQSALDGKAALVHTHDAAAVISGELADARISESSVTQHEAALEITESQITDLSHTDPAAFHDDESGEIEALALKSTVVDDDLVVIEDSEDTYSKKKVKMSAIGTGGGGGGSGGATATVMVRHLIEEIINTTAGSVAFSSGLSGYDNFVIDVLARSNRASQTQDSLAIYFNGDDTDSNYWYQNSRGTAGSASADDGALSYIGGCPAASSPSNEYGCFIIDVNNCSDSKNKIAISRLYSQNTSSSAQAGLVGVRWNNTSAITSITLESRNSASFFGVFKLYGMVETTLGGGTPTPVTNAATPYTLAIGDAYTCQRFTAASPAVTIPVEASVAYPVGTEISIRQAGTGTLTLTTTGLTINGTVPSWAQNVEVMFRKVGADEWDVV